jgi:hypothetical protein
MEFPPEIVAIIREYSRPCFKYFREYHRVLRLCGKARWPLLKEGLHRPGILIYVLAYEKALTEWKKASCRPTLCTHYYWGDPRLVRDEYYRSKRLAHMKALNDLVLRLK